MRSDAALAISDLSYAYGARPVLKNVNITIPPGQFAVLLGPNGAGKTTLFSLITQLFAFRQGNIVIQGHDVSRQPLPALAAIGVVFQQPTLDLDLSVQQNLRYHAALHGISVAEADRLGAQALEQVGMSAELKTQVRHLSGGQRRRVEIGRALIHSPRFLLLDEPTVGLDSASRQAILAHVRNLCGTTGLGVLWATHLFDEVEDTDHLIVLDKGVVQAHGPAHQIITDTKSETLGAAFAKLVGPKP